MKQCHVCHIRKDLGDFYRNSKTRDGRQSYCKVCAVKIRIEHYRTSGGKLKKLVSQARYRHRNLEYLKKYLIAHPCIDCGESDIIVLEFDHKDQATKVASIANMIKSHSLSKIQLEVAKCDVRCANCHRRRTATQLGWTSRA